MSISIELAQRVLGACKQRAQELHAPVSIAIVDAGGHLVLFERMMAPYGWATGDMSIAKAHTSVMFNQPTAAIAQWGAAIPGFASSLATMTQGKFIMSAGGWPLRVDGITVGGVGVSGGNAPGRDDDIAHAGVAVIEDTSQAARPAEAPPATPLYAPPVGSTISMYRDANAAQAASNQTAPPFYQGQESPTTHYLPASEASEASDVDPYRAFRSDSANQNRPNRPGEQQ